MDEKTTGDGQFVASSMTLGPTPSFWLRLAHYQRYKQDHHPGTAALRSIHDHEWILQHQGDTWCALPEQGGVVIIPEGCVALIPPGFRHAQSNPQGSHFAAHFDIHANPERGADAMLAYEGRMMTRPSRLLHPIVACYDGTHRRTVPMVQRPRDLAHWVSSMQELAELWGSGRYRQAGVRLRSASILSDLLYRFVYGNGTAVDQRQPEEAIWNSLIQRDISDRGGYVADMAVACGLGETAYRAAVKKLTGLSPSRWLERRRCEHAVVLLQRGDANVSEVAARCGYDDPYHFSRVFRRHFGRPPSAFKP